MRSFGLWLRSIRCSERALHALAPRITAALLLAASPAAGATWDHVRGDAANSGFADVITAPAVRPSATVPNIGTYAPGAGPVIGPDGTVYLGSRQGVLRAFHPDGTLAWSRSLSPPAGQEILTSPVVDTDGSLYVVSTLRYFDGSTTPHTLHAETRLYHFDRGAALLWVTKLPSTLPSVTGLATDFGVAASPNILRNGQTMAILVQEAYLGAATRDLDLLAYSQGGQLLTRRLISGIAGAPFAEGGLQFGLFPPLCFRLGAADSFNRLPAGLVMPLPGAAIFTSSIATPRIVTSDQYRTTVEWAFSPTTGFTNLFRKGTPGAAVLDPPMLLDGLPVIVADQVGFNDCNQFADVGGRVMITRADGVPLSDDGFSTGQGIAAARTADGRLVVTHSYGMEVTYSLANNPHNGSLLHTHIDYPAETIAPAAVSRSHIFVSTAGSFRTYDARTLALVGELDWNGGGQSGAAIGPDGRVYALASNVLFVWPKPPCIVAALCLPPFPPISAPFPAAGIAR